MAKNHFVDNKKLYEAFLEYHETPIVQEFLARKKAILDARERGEKVAKFSEIPPPFPDYIAKCIFLIAHNYARKPNWRHLSYIDEMISDAILFCLKYGYNFNPHKYNNPFAYITQGVYNAFLQRIAKERDQDEIVKEYIRRAGTGQSESFESMEGPGSFGTTTHVQLLNKHYDDVEQLNSQTKTQVKKKLTRRKAKPTSIGVDKALDV